MILAIFHDISFLYKYIIIKISNLYTAQFGGTFMSINLNSLTSLLYGSQANSLYSSCGTGYGNTTDTSLFSNLLSFGSQNTTTCGYPGYGNYGCQQNGSQGMFMMLIMMLLKMLLRNQDEPCDPTEPPKPPVIDPLPDGPKKATTNTENYLCAERGADKDKNGTDRTELIKYIEAEKKQIADLEDILTREYHEPDELKQLQAKLQWHRQQLLVAERMKSNFANLDTNRDGKVSYEEILAVAGRDGDVKQLSDKDLKFKFRLGIDNPDKTNPLKQADVNSLNKKVEELEQAAK